MSPEELAEIQARCDAATPGPWFVRKVGVADGFFHSVAYSLVHADTDSVALTEGNVTFQAHAREDVPKLLAALRESEKWSKFYDLQAQRIMMQRDAATKERDALRARLAQKEQVLEREAAGWSEQVQALRSEVEALNAQTVKIVHAQTVLEKQRDEARAEVERLKGERDAAVHHLRSERQAYDDARAVAQKARAEVERLKGDGNRLADEVAALVRRKVIDSRSPAADALLDFRDPPSTPRADALAEARAEVERLKHGDGRWGCAKAGCDADATQIIGHCDAHAGENAARLAEAKALLNRWLQRDDSMANCEATVQMAITAWLKENP